MAVRGIAVSKHLTVITHAFVGMSHLVTWTYQLLLPNCCEVYDNIGSRI